MSKFLKQIIWTVISTTVLFSSSIFADNFQSWSRHAPLQFSGYTRSESLQNFPALIVLGTNVAGFAYEDFLSPPYADLRFTDSSRTNALNFEVESWDTNGCSYIWVQVPLLAGTNTAIWAHWGKAGENIPDYVTNGAMWSNDYIGVWHMAQTNALDSTPNRFDGTAQGTVPLTQTVGVANGALNFTADKNYVSVPDSSAFTLTSSYTVSAWVQSDTGANDWESIIGTYNNNGFIFAIDNSANKYLQFFAGGGWYTSATTIPDGVGKHVAFTREGSVGNFYVDGVSVATTGARNGGDGGELQIGAGGVGWGTQRFNGQIDEVRLENVTRGSNWMWACNMTLVSNSQFIAYPDLRVPLVDNALGASNVTTVSASLNGTLISTGRAPTEVWVFWDTEDHGTNKTWSNSLRLDDASIGSVSTNVILAELDAAYFYRFYASNEFGEAWASPSESFQSGSVTVTPSIPTSTFGSPSAFTLSRPGAATNGALTVRYNLSGSAVNGLDYTTLSGEAVIPEGSSFVTVPVVVTQDMDYTNETVVLTLAAGAYAVGTPNVAEVTITPWSVVETQTGNWYVAKHGNDSWDGTSWATAFATISNGVEHAVGGQTVLVGVGTYMITTQINVTTNLTLWGVGGSGNTIVTRDPAFTNRILSMTHAGATVDGFTITNGLENTTAYGGGVYMAGGKLLNSLITGNTNSVPGNRSYGGGLYASDGLVSNCIIRANKALGTYAKGGGVVLAGNATALCCVIEGNTAVETGGGVAFVGGGRMFNSLITSNSAGNMGAVYVQGAARMANCTIVSNKGGTVFGVENAATFQVTNTICYFNSPNEIYAAAAPYFFYSCSTGLTQNAVSGNITNDPLFVDAVNQNFRLQTGSPCIDTGASGIWAPADTDLEGNLRIQHGFADMGAYESPSEFGCNFVSDKTTGFVPLTNVLTAYVSGTNLASTYYWWDVNADGIVDQQGYDKQIITNTYNLPGLYSVALMVSNAIGQVDAFTNRNYISVSTPSMYVSPAGSGTLPYDTWEKAATTIQDAVSFAADGSTIFITNGTYVLSDAVVLPLSTTLKGVNGASVTTIDGNGTKPCFLLKNAGAILDGLTISNGYSSIDGGGMTVSAGTVQNCVIRNNNAGRYGGGVYLGNGTLKNCVIFGNASLGSTAPLTSSGGGVYMTNGVLLHCTIANNTAVRGSVNGGDGLAMTGGSVSNSVVYFNSVFPYTQYQRNVYKTGGTFAYSCTIPAVAGTGNTAGDPQFADRLAGNYHLLPGSPCIDRGTNILGLITDHEGTSRPLDGDMLAGAVVDMGAYEAEAINAGAFRCNFIAVTNEGVNALSNVVFNAYVAGAVTNVQSYDWDFTNDDVVDASGGDKNPVSNTFGVGFHTVRLSVTNIAAQGTSVVKPGYIRIASPILYVSPNGSATLPYNTWAKAATNLNAAVEAAYTAGCTQQVAVTNGQYGLDRQLELLGPIVLTGLGGASNTEAFRTGAYVHRIAYMTHAAAVIDGLTLTNGLENTTANGGGVWMSAGSLQNCIVVKNTDADPGARPVGGGVYASGGVISDCAILNNSSSGSYGKAGGVNALNTVVQRCLIEGNVASEGYGGGIQLQGASRVENCLIRRNNTRAVFFSQGNKAMLLNCTVVENTGGQGISIWSDSTSCTGLNCIVYNNTAPDSTNYSPSSVIQYSCAPNLTPGVDGNITNSPLFVDQAAGDFRLQKLSPCLDSGLNGNWTRADMDLDGNSRLLNGTVDMGAYETRLSPGTAFLFR